MAAMAESASTIDAFLSMAQRMPHLVAIRETIVYHKADILSIMDRQAHKYKVFEPLNRHLPVFKIGRLTRSGKRYVGVVAILPGSQRYISRVITVSQSGFWHAVVRWLVKKHFYPNALPVYFKQQEIAEALSALEAALPAGQSIHLSDVTSKEERIVSRVSVRKDYDTHRIWTDTPWRSVFSNASERGLWFTGLKFGIQQERRAGPATLLASGRIYKYGEIHFDFNYETITEAVIRTLEARAAARLELYRDRGLRERNYEPSQPIQISFDENVFQGAPQIREFARVMSDYPQASKAVYHGNPYYHAGIADYIDGSSFEMWVLSQNKILVIPQAKSSTQAFERLISYVFSEFNEGKVGVYSGSGTQA
jgi:hypothetical protein